MTWRDRTAYVTAKASVRSREDYTISLRDVWKPDLYQYDEPVHTGW